MKYVLKCDRTMTCEAELSSPCMMKTIIKNPGDSSPSADWCVILPEWMFHRMWEPVPAEPHPFIQWLEGLLYFRAHHYRTAKTSADSLAEYVNNHPPPAPPDDPREPPDGSWIEIVDQDPLKYVEVGKSGDAKNIPWKACTVTEKGIPDGWAKDNEFMECESCRKKSGTPILCQACVHNRALIAHLQERVSEFKDAGRRKAKMLLDVMQERDDWKKEADQKQAELDDLQRRFRSALAPFTC